MGKKDECCYEGDGNGGCGILSGDFLSLIIVLAIVVVFLTVIGGEEEKRH